MHRYEELPVLWFMSLVMVPGAEQVTVPSQKFQSSPKVPHKASGCLCFLGGGFWAMQSRRQTQTIWVGSWLSNLVFFSQHVADSGSGVGKADAFLGLLYTQSLKSESKAHCDDYRGRTWVTRIHKQGSLVPGR